MYQQNKIKVWCTSFFTLVVPRPFLVVGQPLNRTLLACLFAHMLALAYTLPLPCAQMLTHTLPACLTTPCPHTYPYYVNTLPCLLTYSDLTTFCPHFPRNNKIGLYLIYPFSPVVQLCLDLAMHHHPLALFLSLQ